jgi:hypothetical protein
MYFLFSLFIGLHCKGNYHFSIWMKSIKNNIILFYFSLEKEYAYYTLTYMYSK